MTSAQESIPLMRAVRGRVLSFVDDPVQGGSASFVYREDGLVVLADGRIRSVGDALRELPRLPPGCPIDRYPGCLVLPGLIDLHTHFPQSQVIASWGATLLDWLDRYTFPAEAKFVDAAHARAGADFFCDELLRNGTTTAAVYATSHAGAADAIFTAAAGRGMRLVAGKVLMDRNAPDAVLDTAQRGYDDSKALIARWHGKQRLSYAVTPRFAITSTPAQLELAGVLCREFPDLHVQTHLGETTAEVAAVRSLYPAAAHYAAVYAGHGLLGPRTLLGHCVHLEAAERRVLHEAGSIAVFCPTANLFLGSGLFDLAAARSAPHPLRIGLGTDVGGGTSYSMLRTAGEAYKVCRLRGHSLTALDAFHMMTRGNAVALGFADRIGRVEPGLEADLVVLDARSTPAMAHRMATVENLAEELFVLMTMGDDRAVRATYVGGRRMALREPVATAT